MQARTSLRIAVCDDSPIFLNKTKTYIETWSANTGHAVQIFTYDNGDALIEAHKDCHMDIIFLDIIMPLLNGMDTARELRQHDRAVQIIFLTSSPEFALESYEVRAQGYILKPVSQEKLSKELNEIIYVFLTIFLYLLKCPQSLILSALRAFCFCGKPHISRSIFLYFRYQAWLKSW